jgi:cobalamin-dependent methionine synthase I
MRNTLIDKFEGNDQIKRNKLTELEIKFENFKLENGESIDDMYYRILQIQNDFIELGELLSNNKIVENILRVMFREPRWEVCVSALEILSETQTFTLDELFAHLQDFEEKLRQTHELEPKTKVMVFPAQHQKYFNQRSYNSSNSHLSNDIFLNKVYHGSSKNVLLRGML